MKKILLIVTLYITVLEVYSQKVDKGLEYIGASSGYLSHYAKISTIKRDGNMTYKVWVYSYPQMEHENECKVKLIKDTKNEKYANFGYTVSLYYIECKKDKIGMKSIIDYNKSGEIIFNNETHYPDYQSVIPDTIGELIYNFVCIYVKKSNLK